LYASPLLSFTPNPYAQLGWFNPETYYSNRLSIWSKQIKYSAQTN
jgi:hypothetical protein